MKKILIFALFMVFCSLGINAFAKSYEVEFEEIPEKIVIAEFSQENLVGINTITVEPNSKTAVFETETEKVIAYLLYDEGIKEGEIKQQTQKEEESETEDEVQIETEKFPAVYDIEKDANRAIMVVNSVASLYDDENLIELSVLYHGKEYIFRLSDDITISSSPDSITNLSGESVLFLKKGDVVRINASFSGLIKDVALIFRPPSENPLFSGVDFGEGFTKLFSVNGSVTNDPEYKANTPNKGVVKKGYGYAYGVIIDRNDYELEIRDKNGDVLIIDIADGAIIYEADREEKFAPEASSKSAIRRTSGSIESVKDGEFLGWNSDGNYNFAFLRTIDSEATEIVIYKNY